MALAICPVAAIEIVLPDGAVARASKTDRPDLFWGAASAFGTLGVVTLLELQLREAHADALLLAIFHPSGPFGAFMGHWKVKSSVVGRSG